VAAGVSPSAPRPKLGTALLGHREFTLVAIIGVCAVTLTLLRPEFLRASNLLSIATSVVYDVPLAAGMTLVLIVRGIDLSVGAVLALSGVVMTLALRDGWPVPIAVGTGFLLAAGIGALNGLLVARLRLAPFIVTLGTMSMARGAAVVLTSGYMISGLPASYIAIGRSEWIGVALPVWVILVLLLAFDRLVRRWQPLHDAFFVGGNHEAARLSGLPAARLTAAAYVVSAMCAALAALFMTSRLGMGYAKFGELGELRAIAAAVLGGATFSGGAGSVAGAALGVLLLAIVMNGFVLLNLSIYWQSVATGLIVVIAVGLDTARRRRRGEIP
jgi:ribose transport system permease protein